MSCKIGIYGGSFSPPHAGHLRAARTFWNVAGLDKLIIMPAASAPNKKGVSTAASVHRLEMAKIAFGTLDIDCEVSDFEISRGGISYTIDTLEHFSRQGELSFLMGSDMFLSLESWRRFEDILKITEIVCVRRENDPEIAENIAALGQKFAREYGARIIVVSDEPIPTLECDNGGYMRFASGEITELSSSELRPLYDGGREANMPRLDEFIRFFELYKSDKKKIDEKMLDALREEIYRRQSEKRFAHTLGVEKTAARLGELFMPDDVMRLRAAALLHDVTKEISCEKQLQILLECDTISDGCTKVHENALKMHAYELYGTEPLWHSVTASKILAREFTEYTDPGICDMVRWHTTGRAGMTVGELIVCLSDFIEPTRKYSNSSELREMLKAGLDSAKSFDEKLRALIDVSCEMLSRTVNILTSEGREVSHESIEALNWLRGEYSLIYG